jgi:nicotinamide-nucleotide amidase
VRPRAAVVVTGSELVRGERTDLNGPFLAREVLRLGFEPARVTIVGDAVAELEGALRDALADAALVAVSGGLGPTHDDRTIEAVARVTGRPLVVDAALHAEIESIARGYAERMRRSYDDFVPGVRKQATVPEGAVAVGIAGTAPAVVVEHGAAVVVVLPGPPGELQRLWPRALETQPVRAVLAQAMPPTRRSLRFFGISESAVAQALEAAGGEREGVEVTICARDFEIHVDVVVAEGADERAEELLARLREPLERYLFSDDHRSAEAIVLDLLRQRSWTLATAESCTGGMVAERLTGVPGASDGFLGGVVAYADAIKEAELGVPASVLRQHGAVSAETAAAMARGARERLGADVAVAVTGIAGPGGGTIEKPVGLVYVHAESPEGDERLTFDYPGDREAIRRRATVSALHAVRRLLTRTRHEVA